MTNFFLGQRVKLARPANPEKLGIEGHISSLHDEIPAGFPCLDGLSSIASDCCVLWDGESAQRVQHTSQLEPLLPDGMKPASWEDTVWDPSRLIEESKELVCIA